MDLATCDPSEFDAKYEEYCQEYLEGGYQDILDEKQEAMRRAAISLLNSLYKRGMMQSRTIPF